MPQDYSLFYYWDDLGKSQMPEYINLCMESWEKYSDAASITRVNIDNIEALSGGSIKCEDMRLFTPAQRSDAAMAAVMNKRKGLFIDADTLLLPSFDPMKYLNLEKPSMYVRHNKKHLTPLLAFIAYPLKESYFMDTWLNAIQDQIKKESRCFRYIRRGIRHLQGKKSSRKIELFRCRCIKLYGVR